MQTPVYLTESEAQTVADALSALACAHDTRYPPDVLRGVRDKFRHACGFARVGGSGWALRPAGSDGRR